MLEKSEFRFLPLGARRVAYEVRGDGPPLVAPAWWVSHLELDWRSDGFRRFWHGVAEGYTLIRYDHLGVGMSDRTVHESDLCLESEVATLKAVLDALELERVTLIGRQAQAVKFRQTAEGLVFTLPGKRSGGQLPYVLRFEGTLPIGLITA